MREARHTRDRHVWESGEFFFVEIWWCVGVSNDVVRGEVGSSLVSDGILFFVGILDYPDS